MSGGFGGMLSIRVAGGAGAGDGGPGRRPGVQAGHLARRRGEPDRASPQLRGAVLPGAGRPASAVRRHRGARRPGRRPGGRARARSRRGPRRQGHRRAAGQHPALGHRPRRRDPRRSASKTAPSPSRSAGPPARCCRSSAASRRSSAPPCPEIAPCGWSGRAAARRRASAGDLAERVRDVLDARSIRPSPPTAARRPWSSVDGGWVRVRLEGGCQGCSLAEVTLRQGIEPVLRARLPGVTGLADVTEHEAGTEPFFSPAKR